MLGDQTTLHAFDHLTSIPLAHKENAQTKTCQVLFQINSFPSSLQHFISLQYISETMYFLATLYASWKIDLFSHMYNNCIILYNVYFVIRSRSHPVLTINSAASRKASLVSFDRLPMKENGSTSGVQSRWKRHESNCSFTLSTAHRCLLLHSHHRWPCHLHNSFHCPCQQPKTSGVTAPQHWMFLQPAWCWLWWQDLHTPWGNNTGGRWCAIAQVETHHSTAKISPDDAGDVEQVFLQRIPIGT